jgi:hypothetical protein
VTAAATTHIRRMFSAITSAPLSPDVMEPSGS